MVAVPGARLPDGLLPGDGFGQGVEVLELVGVERLVDHGHAGLVREQLANGHLLLAVWRRTRATGRPPGRRSRATRASGRARASWRPAPSRWSRGSRACRAARASRRGRRARLPRGRRPSRPRRRRRRRRPAPGGSRSCARTPGGRPRSPGRLSRRSRAGTMSDGPWRATEAASRRGPSRPRSTATAGSTASRSRPCRIGLGPDRPSRRCGRSPHPRCGDPGAWASVSVQSAGSETSALRIAYSAPTDQEPPDHCYNGRLVRPSTGVAIGAGHSGPLLALSV